MEWLANWVISVDWELVIRIIIQCCLFTMSAAFAGSETALFSLSRIDLQKLRNSRNPHSEKIHAMLDEPRKLIVSILCGNELVNIAAAANMTMILVGLFGAEDAGWINILVMVPLLLLFGEVTPKTIAVNFPVKFTTRISAPILPRWIIIVTPLRNVVRLVADRVTSMVVGEPVGRENILKVDELRTLMADSEETGVIEASERVIIDKVLEATETDVARIMTPGPQIRFLDADLPIAELIERFRSYRHPRTPVYRGHWDNVIGFLHAEDVLQQLRCVDDVSKIQLADIVRPAHFVPPTKKVDEMLHYFQRFNTRAAVVIGEYGEVLGIIAIKDVLSFLFGEISGKMRDQEYYQQEDNDSFTVPGYMRLTDLHTLTNFDIDDPLMHTIGGVTLTLFGRLPRVGEKIFYLDYEITVKEVTGTRITKVRVSRGSIPSETETETSPEESLNMESVAESSAAEMPQQAEKQESLDEFEDELVRQSEPSEQSTDDAGSSEPLLAEPQTPENSSSELEAEDQPLSGHDAPRPQ